VVQEFWISCASAGCKKSNTQRIGIPDEHALRFIQEQNPNAEVIHPALARGPSSSISCSSGTELELRGLMKLETMSGSNGCGRKLLCGRKQNKTKKKFLLCNGASGGTRDPECQLDDFGSN